MGQFARRLVMVAVVLTGCDRAERGRLATRAPEGAPLAVPAPASPRADEIAASPAPPAEPQRMIARSAQLRIVVSDPVATAQRLGADVEARGGYVSDSRQWRSGDQMLASLTIRVPATDLSATLDSIRHRAIRVESETVSGEDVTEQYTDLRAQLVNLRATETELRALLATVRQRTQKASDILEVFNQLTSIRGQLDRTEARLATLSRLTELATITVELVPDALAQPLTTGPWRPITVVRAAFRTLLATLKWLLEATIWLVLYVIPVVLVLAVPAFGLWTGVRAVRKRVSARR